MNRRDFLKASLLCVAWAGFPVLPSIPYKLEGYPDFSFNCEYGNAVDLTGDIFKMPKKHIRAILHLLETDVRKYLPEGMVYELRYLRILGFERRSAVAWYYNQWLPKSPLGIFNPPVYREENGYYLLGRLRSKGKFKLPPL